jgi:hypothetical protein
MSVRVSPTTTGGVLPGSTDGYASASVKRITLLLYPGITSPR